MYFEDMRGIVDSPNANSSSQGGRASRFNADRIALTASENRKGTSWKFCPNPPEQPSYGVDIRSHAPEIMIGDSQHYRLDRRPPPGMPAAHPAPGAAGNGFLYSGTAQSIGGSSPGPDNRRPTDDKAST